MYQAIVGSWRCKPLPSNSLSDNLLVVQLSMAHFKVWRWLESHEWIEVSTSLQIGYHRFACTPEGWVQSVYYRHVIYICLCGLRTEQKGTHQIKRMSDEFISTCHTKNSKKCDVKFRYRTQYHLPMGPWKLFSIPKLFASSFYFHQKNYRASVHLTTSRSQTRVQTAKSTYLQSLYL